MLTMNGFLVSTENPYPLPAPKLADFIAIFKRDFEIREFEQGRVVDFEEPDFSGDEFRLDKNDEDDYS